MYRIVSRTKNAYAFIKNWNKSYVQYVAYAKLRNDIGKYSVTESVTIRLTTEPAKRIINNNVDIKSI